MLPPLILVDVFNLVFRCHYTHLSLSSEERPTGVLFGFLKTVHDLRETVSKSLVFCWDHGVPTPTTSRFHNWREEFLPTYKATRKHDDKEYKRILVQLPLLSQVIRWLGYCQVAIPGMEADDLMGILTTETHPLREVLLFSTDRDLYQLLGPHTHILVPKKDNGKFRKVVAADVEKEYKVPINRWAAYLAMGGDSSDNIKPRKGMGPKTAHKLVIAGARPRLSFVEQSWKFQKDHRDLEACWPQIQLSYRAALLPTSRRDSRLKKFYTDLSSLKVVTRQHWENESERRQAAEQFTRFCVDREMLSLLSIRRNLFNSSGESYNAFPQKRFSQEVLSKASR